MPRLYTAIGLMSGTSMDGIDLALIETDGEAQIRFGGSRSVDFEPEVRALLRQAVSDAPVMRERSERPGVLVATETMVTECHVNLVRDFLGAEALSPHAIDVIGFHGQTVLHRPAEKLTVQLGDGRALAAATGIRVVSDLRAADVAAGGQGAPLVPAYHRALVEASGEAGPVAIINLGGVANITYIERGNDPIAFDTGPANALIDDLVLERLGQRYDVDGRLALSGTVDNAALNSLLEHPYFSAKPPKSLDRNAFSRAAVDRLSTEDAAATLAAFTAACVALALDSLPKLPTLWVVCGGGGRNGAIMKELEKRLPARVVRAEALGWSSSLMEAQAFAYLAVRALRGLPLSFPTTTGVPMPLSGGVLCEPGVRSAA